MFWLVSVSSIDSLAAGFTLALVTDISAPEAAPTPRSPRLYSHDVSGGISCEIRTTYLHVKYSSTSIVSRPLLVIDKIVEFGLLCLSVAN